MPLKSLLDTFPPVVFAFAYGSGVVAQAGYRGADPPPMVDLVLAVDDPSAWHAANLRNNRAHYSALGALGGVVLAAVQDGGAGLYYNTHVPLPAAAGGAPGQLMKYGVISVAALRDDLLTWRSLYAAGRLHKPVHILACDAPAVLAATRVNLRHALAAALLQLPAAFTSAQLYASVAGLSYMGDFRMVLGENPHKVANIVAGALPRFHELYEPVLRAYFPTVAAGGSDTRATTGLAAMRFTQDTSPAARLALGLALPLRLQRAMAASLLADGAGGGGDLPSSRGVAVHRGGRPVRSLLASAGVAAVADEWLGTPAPQRHASPPPPPPRRAFRRLLELRGPLISAVWSRTAAHPSQLRLSMDVTRRRTPATTPADATLLPPAGADPRVLAFWDEMRARSSKTGGGDAAAPALTFLRQAIARTVGPPARAQALKGVFTAGPVHAAIYGLRKLGKMFAGGRM